MRAKALRASTKPSGEGASLLSLSEREFTQRDRDFSIRSRGTLSADRHWKEHWKALGKDPAAATCGERVGGGLRQESTEGSSITQAASLAQYRCPVPDRVGFDSHGYHPRRLPALGPASGDAGSLPQLPPGHVLRTRGDNAQDRGRSSRPDRRVHDQRVPWCGADQGRPVGVDGLHRGLGSQQTAWVSQQHRADHRRVRSTAKESVMAHVEFNTVFLNLNEEQQTDLKQWRRNVNGKGNDEQIGLWVYGNRFSGSSYV